MSLQVPLIDVSGEHCGNPTGDKAHYKWNTVMGSSLLLHSLERSTKM